MAERRGYNAGTNSLDGQAFIDEFLSDKNLVIHESDEVVLVLMRSCAPMLVSADRSKTPEMRFQVLVDASVVPVTE